MTRPSEKQLAGEGAMLRGLMELQTFADAYDQYVDTYDVAPVAELSDVRPATCVLGSVTGHWERDTIVVADGTERVRIGPCDTVRAACTIPWLVTVARKHGLPAAKDCAHMLGVIETRHAAAWRNYWYSSSRINGPEGGPELHDEHHVYDGQFSCHAVSAAYLGGYLACWQAVGVKADAAAQAKVTAWLDALMQQAHERGQL